MRTRTRILLLIQNMKRGINNTMRKKHATGRMVREHKDGKSFWKKLPRYFTALAPMADVTDVAFRTMFARYGRPDVFWTEFVSADGLCSSARDLLSVDLLFEEDHRPIVAQLFTSTPEHMYRAGLYVKELGFDGLDINMGCPDRSVEKQGCGAAMIRNPGAAIEVIHAAKRTGLPVSVKTRIGYNRDEIDSWIPLLLRTGIEALSVHLRTRKEMSSVPAHWEHMQCIVALRDALAPDTLIIGNGDVYSVHEAYDKAQDVGCDGVMVGRGIFGNPWFFNTQVNQEDITVRQRMQALMEHTRLFEDMLPMKRFDIMKKHYKAYVNGFDGAKELRMQLMEEAKNADDVEKCVWHFLDSCHD